MNHNLTTIKDASQRLLGDEHLSYPIRKLACAVSHGADLIIRHQLEGYVVLPQFQRALFHLCHVVDRPLCGRCICEGSGDPERAQSCDPNILLS